MEQNIKTLVRQLAIAYAAYIICVLAFAATYEFMPGAKGALAGNAAAEYTIDTMCMLLTIIVVPLSIKIFAKMIARHRSLDIAERAARYHVMWNIRILCYAIVTVMDLWAYYATLNNIGAFCALICVIASLLFLPTRKRIGDDLGTNDRGTPQ